MSPEASGIRLFSRPSWSETRVVTEALRAETVGGGLLLLAAVIALVWANSPWRGGYQALRELTVGPAAGHLDLSLQTWSADGLLAIFFFVAGVELKRELVVGDLRDVRRAAVPVVAAMAGVAVPALLYVLLTAGDAGASAGWAIPTATDIAFALAVLAVLGTHLPTALRAFLLTLAVVDDLVAITIIAVFYTNDLDVAALLGALVPLVAFAVAVRRRHTGWWLLLPLGAATWALVHESGVHATVAGVLLGLVVPVRTRQDEDRSVGERLEHLVRPVSAGVAVPVFALFAAGVPLTGGGLAGAVRDPVFAAIMVALVLGKAVGVLGGAWLTARFTRAELDESLAWTDLLGLSLLAGIGFTVSLLIGELAFGAGTARDDHVKVAVLAGSLVAALLAAVVLRARNRVYRRIHEAETRGHGQPTSLGRDQGGPPRRGAVVRSGGSRTVTQERTIGQLVADATQDVSELVRHEIALAKTELKRDITRGGIGAGMLAAAGFFGVVAFILLCFAGAYGLVAAGLDEWLSFLIVFVVLIVIAGVLAMIGKSQLQKVQPPERTIATTKGTVAALKGQH